MPFTVDQIAEMAYELNRAYNDVIGNQWLDPPWTGIPQWYQAAMADGVRAVLAGMRAPQLHRNWCAYYTRLGWRWGEVKDLAARTHPNIVSWQRLSPEQQLKDVLFREQVLMLARIGESA